MHILWYIITLEEFEWKGKYFFRENAFDNVVPASLYHYVVIKTASVDTIVTTKKISLQVCFQRYQHAAIIHIYNSI